MTDQQNAAVRVELSASTRLVRLPRRPSRIIRAYLRAYPAMNAVLYGCSRSVSSRRSHSPN